MLVRVESTHRIRAGHALDLGAAGIMFPGIESADQATQAIRHLRYPSDGDRGVATYNRAYGFGLPPERLETANERVLGIVQIESKQAVDRVEEITKVPGIHVLFIGPRHLSHDLGVPGDTSAPAFQDALQRAFWPPPRPQASPRESSLPTPRPRAGTPTKAWASSSSALTPPCSPSPANTPSTASTAPEHPGEKDQDRGGDAQRVRRAV